MTPAFKALVLIFAFGVFGTFLTPIYGMALGFPSSGPGGLVFAFFLTVTAVSLFAAMALAVLTLPPRDSD